MFYLLLIFGFVIFSAVGFFTKKSWLGNFGFPMVDRPIEQLLSQLDQQLRAYQNMPAHLRAQQQSQLFNQWLQASDYMHQLDGLQKQWFDLKMSELQGMAAQAGLDWKPPSY